MRTNLFFIVPVGAAMLLGVLGCSDHHHDDDHRDRVVTYDAHGYRHEGYRDDAGNWHGGYYDEHNTYHDDPQNYR